MALGFKTPVGAKIFVGYHAGDAAATAEVKAQKWDTTKDGNGNPEPAFMYWDTNATPNQMKWWNGSAWVAPILSSGAIAMAADLSFGSAYHLTNLADGTTGTQDSCTVAQMEAHVASVEQGLFWLDDVDAFALRTGLPAYTRATDVLTADANGAFPTQDGVSSALNKRYLVATDDGGGHIDNGVYKLTQLGDGDNPWKLTREPELSNGDSAASRVVGIDDGTTYGERTYRCKNDAGTDVVNTDALIFDSFSKAIDHASLLNLTSGDPHTQYAQESLLAGTGAGTEGAALIGTDSKTNLGASTTVEACLTFLDGQNPPKFSTNAGNPNGTVAGASGDLCLDTTNHIMYYNDGGANTNWYAA